MSQLVEKLEKQAKEPEDYMAGAVLKGGLFLGCPRAQPPPPASTLRRDMAQQRLRAIRKLVGHRRQPGGLRYRPPDYISVPVVLLRPNECLDLRTRAI
jgi:hypothetical protein